jgi:hypothetical protein
VAPSGAIISTFKHPSANSSAAFFIAAGTESRRSVMIPDVSSAVMKNFMGGSEPGWSFILTRKPASSRAPIKSAGEWLVPG